MSIGPVYVAHDLRLRRVTCSTVLTLTLLLAMVNKWRSFSRTFARAGQGIGAESGEHPAPVLANGTTAVLLGCPLYLDQDAGRPDLGILRVRELWRKADCGYMREAVRSPRVVRPYRTCR